MTSEVLTFPCVHCGGTVQVQSYKDLQVRCFRFLFTCHGEAYQYELTSEAVVDSLVLGDLYSRDPHVGLTAYLRQIYVSKLLPKRMATLWELLLGSDF